MSFKNFVYYPDLQADKNQSGYKGGFYDLVRLVTVYNARGIYDGDLYQGWRGFIVRFDGIEGKDVHVIYRHSTAEIYIVKLWRGYQFMNDENRQYIKDIVSDALRARQLLQNDRFRKIKPDSEGIDISLMQFEYQGWGDEPPLEEKKKELMSFGALLWALFASILSRAGRN